MQERDSFATQSWRLFTRGKWSFNHGMAWVSTLGLSKNCASLTALLDHDMPYSIALNWGYNRCSDTYMAMNWLITVPNHYPVIYSMKLDITNILQSNSIFIYVIGHHRTHYISVSKSPFFSPAIPLMMIKIEVQWNSNEFSHFNSISILHRNDWNINQ